MEEHELKLKFAQELRERIFKIPRQNREYELLYQPTIQVNQTPEETKVMIKFTLGHGDNVFACKIRIEAECVYAKVGSVGPYFDKMKLKGTPDRIISEFVKWLQFARRGTKDGEYAILLCQNKPVGFMVHTFDSAYSYAFFAREIAGSGLKPQVLLSKYYPSTYNGDVIDCWYEEGKLYPKQWYGKALKPVEELDLESRQTLLWSFLCRLTLMK